MDDNSGAEEVNEEARDFEGSSKSKNKHKKLVLIVNFDRSTYFWEVLGRKYGKLESNPLIYQVRSLKLKFMQLL